MELKIDLNYEKDFDNSKKQKLREHTLTLLSKIGFKEIVSGHTSLDCIVVINSKNKIEKTEGCKCKDGEAMWVDGECFECGNKLSEKDWGEIKEELKIEEQQRRRNILNRKITTLKKANLKESPKDCNCVNCNKAIGKMEYPFCSDKCQEEAHKEDKLIEVKFFKDYEKYSFSYKKGEIVSMNESLVKNFKGYAKII